MPLHTSSFSELLYFYPRKVLHLILLFLTTSLCCLIRYSVVSEGSQHLSLVVLTLASHPTHPS